MIQSDGWSVKHDSPAKKLSGLSSREIEIDQLSGLVWCAVIQIISDKYVPVQSITCHAQFYEESKLKTFLYFLLGKCIALSMRQEIKFGLN